MLKNWKANGPLEANERGPLGHYEISAGEIGNRQCVVQCVYSERYALAIAAAMNAPARAEEEDEDPYGNGEGHSVCPAR